jgi:hypothetical protein
MADSKQVGGSFSSSSSSSFLMACPSSAAVCSLISKSHVLQANTDWALDAWHGQLIRGARACRRVYEHMTTPVPGQQQHAG